MVLSSERLAARRRNLVAAAEALIRECGDAGFSMALLAKRAGVSAATPYNLLGSKSEILRLVLLDDLARFEAELAGHAAATPLAALLGAADLLVSHYRADRPFNEGLFHAACGAEGREFRWILGVESGVVWKRLVQAALDSGELASFVRPQLLTDALLRMMGVVVQSWLAEGWTDERFTLEMRASVRLVLASVSAPEQRDNMIREIAELHAALDTLLPDQARPARNAANA